MVRLCYGHSARARLLTDLETAEYRTYLLKVRKPELAPSSINLRLAAVKGLVRHHGRLLYVKGVQQVRLLVRALSGRELGRLLAAVEEDDDWLARRDTATQISRLARDCVWAK